jgi:hypothetical protein
MFPVFGVAQVRRTTLTETYSSGTLTLNGFAHGGDDVTAFTLVNDFDDNNSNYIFNFPSTEQVTATGTGAWSLDVTLTDNGGSAGDETLWFGNQQVAGEASNGSPVSHTFTGADVTSLTALVESLHVGTPNGAPDSFSVTLSLDGGATFFTENFAVACYHEGTRIATQSGEVPVEALEIGDLVVTASGDLKPVKWIGRRAYPAAAVASNRHLQPVLVRKDAIAPGMPHRDLMVSPMHALFVDDAFVPAISLVNGVSILRCDDLMAVSYVHIEMDGHDVIFAEGLPAETFVDDNSRLMFENADEFYALYGADHVAAAFAAPRLEEGVQLEALRRRIAARAGVEIAAVSSGMLRGNVERVEDGVLHGWMADVTGSAPVEVEILVDGEVVARTIANRYRVDLDHAGIAGGIAGFTAALPASVENLAQVSVRRAGDGMALGARAAKATV